MTTTATPLARPRTDTPPHEGSIVDVLNHEIRTPLTVVMGHAELLEELELWGKAAHSVAAIAAAAQRLARVAEELAQVVGPEVARLESAV